MKNWNRIQKALSILNLKEPDCCFVAPRESSMLCLHFARQQKTISPSQKLALTRLGVYDSAKYDTYCISTEVLFDHRND